MKYSINNETDASIVTAEQGLKALQICEGITKMLGDFAKYLEVINITFSEPDWKYIVVYLVFVQPSLVGESKKIKVGDDTNHRYLESNTTVGHIILDVAKKTRRKLDEELTRVKVAILPFLETGNQTITTELEKIQCKHVDDGAGGQREPYHCRGEIANFAGEEPVPDGDIYCVVHIQPHRRREG